IEGLTVRLMHAGGVAHVPLADLPADALARLGMSPESVMQRKQKIEAEKADAVRKVVDEAARKVAAKKTEAQAAREYAQDQREWPWQSIIVSNVLKNAIIAYPLTRYGFADYSRPMFIEGVANDLAVGDKGRAQMKRIG